MKRTIGYKAPSVKYIVTINPDLESISVCVNGVNLACSPEENRFIAYAANHALEIVEALGGQLSEATRERDLIQRNFEAIGEDAAMWGCENSELKDQNAELQAENAALKAALDRALGTVRKGMFGG